MGRSVQTGASDYFASGASGELPEHSATVDPYLLDKYEVTVGRFRQFVLAYSDWHTIARNPKTDAGAHPKVANSGWASTWTATDKDLPADPDALKLALHCDASYATWSDVPGTGEVYPINCVTFYVAFAFCIWDGGRLPSEAEWEYAASGGERNQLYPWGADAPDATRANYVTNGTPRFAVGSLGARSAGYFGHLDLAGSVSEWVLDWYAAGYYGTAANPVNCSNCVNTTPAVDRVVRGGDALGSANNLRSAYRGVRAPATISIESGFRCARSL
jgi:formylglycine-generating enzyme required for sulfatase activity